MHKSAMHNPTLVINSGSSSLKYALISADNQHRITGLAENLGANEAQIVHKDLNGEKSVIAISGANHKEALVTILEILGDYKPIAVGHRAVHGGHEFSQAQRVSAAALAQLKRLTPLAPLHNPANIVGIEAVQAIYPQLPQVMVFDTAFHQTMPPKAYRYAIPKALYETHFIRRYGFHGTSHAYVSDRARELTEQLSTTNNASKLNPSSEGSKKQGWLTAHLGNGCSAAAIYEGKSLDTSMGLTPLEGLMMGTRSGDVDPGLHAHLKHTLGMSLEDIDAMLNKQSGLLGVTGVSNDMRAVEEMAADNTHPNQADANLALEMFCYRVAKYLAALSCALPELTGIVFTGGIGENGADIRARIVADMRHFGLQMDSAKNAKLIRGQEGSFHGDNSRYALWVIPTDEEYRIALETRQTLGL